MRARTVAGLLAAALLLKVATANTLFANYECPITCDASPNCKAASNSPPGGLAPSDTPQFIVLTNDDAITLVTQPVILNITERHPNRNGCKMGATWFVSTAFTDPVRAKETWELGHEIATHTMNHVSNPNATEIVGARKWLNETAGIPLEDIQGFRAPYLLYNPRMRQILYENGFRYDSSISEQYSNRHPLSPNAQSRMWPYTFDCGVASDCNIGTGTCDDSERWNGLWEFPLYAAQDEQGTVIGTMDPQGDLFEIYKREFDNRYSGNRAPVGIYLHAAWLIANPTAADQINRFLDYAMTKDNVFLVTISQVLDWMKNPVPASQYDPGCKAIKTAGNACMPPSSGCGPYGTFNADSCQCDCQNENVNIAGYCKDTMASCTVQKEYNFDTKLFYCPTQVQPTYTPDMGTGSGTTAGQTPSAPSTSAPNPAAMTASGEPKCGHPLVRFLGMSASGVADPSVLYANNLRTIDGECGTCALIQAVNGQAFYELRMENVRSLKGVQLLTSAENTTVDIRVGNDQSNNGRLNPTCAVNVAIPANTPTPVPCMAQGSSLVITSNGNLTLCDVYPMDADTQPSAQPSTGSAPATGGSAQATPAGKPVTLEFDVTGVTAEQYSKEYAEAVCKAIVQMTGDKSASCVVNSVTANSSGRRLLQAQSSSVRVVMTVYVSNPDLIAKAFSNGPMLANLLKPTGAAVVPASVESAVVPVTPSANAPNAPAPAGKSSSDSGSSGSSSNLGAIIGGVVGGVCGLALLCGAGFWFYRRRQSQAVGSGRVPSVSNPVYDATATVTTQRSMKVQPTSASSSPLKDAAASFH